METKNRAVNRAAQGGRLRPREIRHGGQIVSALAGGQVEKVDPFDSSDAYLGNAILDGLDNSASTQFFCQNRKPFRQLTFEINDLPTFGSALCICRPMVPPP